VRGVQRPVTIELTGRQYRREHGEPGKRPVSEANSDSPVTSRRRWQSHAVRRRARRRATIASMGLLIIVSGPPGAGKSTVSRALAQNFERSALVEGDVFFGFVARGAVAPWLPAAHAQNEAVTQAAAAAAGRYSAGGYDTVYDGVVGPWFLPTFMTAAGIGTLHYAVLLPPVEECLARVASRTGHGFTDEEATRHMHAEFARCGIAERHVLAGLPGSADDTAHEILRRAQSGLLRYP
jgi:predicted ABC-type ATPase